jgi:hypothetical protein
MKNNMELAMENYVSKLIDLMSKRLDHLEKESEFCAKNINIVVDRLMVLEAIVANDKGLLNQTELDSFKRLNKKH